VAELGLVLEVESLATGLDSVTIVLSSTACDLPS
jgi:hypothetical protein